LRPTGNAPATASVSWWFPNPVRYLRSFELATSHPHSSTICVHLFHRLRCFATTVHLRFPSLSARITPAASSHDAPRDLLRLDRLEQRLEVAFAKTFIALALDDFKEDRADRILRKDLQ